MLILSNKFIVYWQIYTKCERFYLRPVFTGSLFCSMLINLLRTPRLRCG